MLRFFSFRSLERARFLYLSCWLLCGGCGDRPVEDGSDLSGAGGAPPVTSTGGSLAPSGTQSGGTGGLTSSGGATNVGGMTMTGGANSSGGAPGEEPARPRLTLTQWGLERVAKAIETEPSGPASQGLSKLESTSFADLDYDPSPLAVVHVVGSGANEEEKALRNDAVAAFAHALLFSVTNESAHAQKAIEILDAWSGTLTDVVPTDGSPGVQDELEVAWYAPIWISAAELIRYFDGGSAGWSAEGVASFDEMVGLFRTKADAWGGSQGCCPNQALSVILSRLSIGVYTDDGAYVTAALKYYTDSILERAIADDGEVLEINRIEGGDCGHATYNIEAIFDIAEIAWNNDVDLYSDSRLPLGLEYLAQCITEGVDTSGEGFVHCANMRPVSVEIAYNHYKNRVGGVSLPQTEKLLEILRPSDQGTGKFIPWDTLTHAELDASAP